jgi:hypothetical protein
MTDVDELRKRYPEWDIQTQWITVASGPDRCIWLASHGGITVSAWSPSELERAITRMENDQ